MGAAGGCCLIGEAEAGEAGEVWLGEVQLAQCSKVEGEVDFAFDGDALGVGEGVEDGEAHVGDGDLGEDAAIDKLDERVDGGLGVDGDLDLRGREVEEAAGFDDLEALVHHGGGVDGDALSHDPGGVLECLGGGDVFEVGGGGIAEGATGGGEPDLLDLGRGATAHALVNGVVLGVDGEEGDVVLFCCGDDEFAGGDETFLVGEADGFSGADCGVGGFETGYADDGGDDEVDLGQGGDVNGSGGSGDDFDAGDAGVEETGGEFGGELLGGEGDDLGTPALALVEGDVDFGASSERDDLIAVGEGLADGERGRADGAGGA